MQWTLPFTLCRNPNKIDLTDNLDELIFHFDWPTRS